MRFPTSIVLQQRQCLASRQAGHGSSIVARVQTRQVQARTRSISSSASASSSSSSHPLKLAIIGAGPSGFYTASRLLSLLPLSSEAGQNLEIHMFDRLPTPYGLVRYGVAPDHPEVKNCQHKFDELALDPRFKFFGNVNIVSSEAASAAATASSSSSASIAATHPPSRRHRQQPFHEYTYPCALPLPLSSLFPYYSTILFTYGSSLSHTLPTSVSGSTADPAGPLEGVYPALAFVSWYNGHPAYAHLDIDLSKVEETTVVGHGNVAIDCARMLLRDPRRSPRSRSIEQAEGAVAGKQGLHNLSETDVPESVLEVLRASSVRKVTAVGRRGPGQVSFTTKEFREMVNLPGVEYVPVTGDMMEEAKVMLRNDRMKKRLLDLMSKPGKDQGDGKKQFELGFLKSPKAFLPSSSEPSMSSTATSSRSHVGAVKWGLNTLLPPPEEPPSPIPNPPAAPTSSEGSTSPAAHVVAAPTGEEVLTKSELVIESVGYKSESLTSDVSEGDGDDVGGNRSWRLPFDDVRGRIQNEGGRILDDGGVMIPGMYTAGWVARGPVGVIASTMQNAYAVANLIIDDHFVSSSSSSSSSSLPRSASLLAVNPEGAVPPEIINSSKRIVSIQDWQKIDKAEVENGKQYGKLREKFVNVPDMLAVLD